MSNKSTDAWNRGILRALIKFFHFIAIIQFGYAIYYDFVFVNVPGDALKIKKTNYGGKFKFLTFIDAVKLIFVTELSFRTLIDEIFVVNFMKITKIFENQYLLTKRSGAKQ